VKTGSITIIETVPSGRLQLDGKTLSPLHEAQTMPLYSYFIVDSIAEDKIELRGLNPDKVKSWIADTDTEYVIKKEAPQYILLTGDEKNVRDFVVEAASEKDLWIPLTLIEPESHAACYDPRAIAIAFSRSEYFEAYLNDKRRESSEAEESGNMNLVEKIKKEVQQMQENLHKIAFNGEAADVIFDLVKAKVEEVKKCEATNELVSKWDDSADVDELPDITQSLLAIFTPSRQTREAIEALPEKPTTAEPAEKE
jgi:DNA-binding protein YbaB